MSNYADNSAEFLARIDAEIKKYELRKVADNVSLHKHLKELDEQAGSQCAQVRERVTDRYEQLKQQCTAHVISDYRYVSEVSGEVTCSGTPDADRLLDEARERTHLREILIGRKKVGTETQGNNKILPVFIPWQQTNPLAPGHIQIIYKNHEQIAAFETGNNLLIRMLTAFTPRTVHFTFIDPTRTNASSFFVKNLTGDDASTLYYKKVMTEREDIKQQLQLLNRKIEEIQKLIPTASGTILDYNIEAKQVKSPYEIVVIYDHKELTHHTDLLRPLINNGTKHGIYLLLFTEQPDEKTYGNSQLAELLPSEKLIRIHIGTPEEGNRLTYRDMELKKICENKFRALDDLTLLPENEKNQVFASNPLVVNSLAPLLFLQDYFKDMNKQVGQYLKENKISHDLVSDRNSEYRRADEKFSVPLGESQGKRYDFILDEESNIHTFVLGKTSSGKSTLLHDILLPAVLTYHPDALQLYLMDFKKGGVEFKKYADAKIPHVKTALLDDCDRQIVVEILQELRREMDRRGKLIGSDSNRSTYNSKQSDDKDKLPLIIVAIDECHLLFGQKHDATQETINSIIERIASEGRSQGIHMILATQTLADSYIPEKVMKNITNKFILSSHPADAMKLSPDLTHNDLGLLTQKGQSLYKKEDGKILIQPFYVTNKEKAQLLATAREKAVAEGIDRIPITYSGEMQPTIQSALEQVDARHSMLLGQSIQMSQTPIFAPIHGKDRSNLLLIGNKSEFEAKDPESNAIRVIVSSFLSISSFHEKRNEAYQVFVLNKLNEEENQDVELINAFEDHSGFRFLNKTNQIEELWLELNERIDQKNDEAPMTYLYILGQQYFRELKNNVALPQPEKPEKEASASPASSGRMYMRSRDEFTISSVLQKILKYGPDYNICVVLQVDKESNLLFTGAQSAREYFGYFVLLPMPNMDAERITRNNDIKPEALSSDPKRARAYFYDEIHSVVSIFVPYSFKDKHTGKNDLLYIESKIN
ncbi:MAG: hypothetical protein LIP08_02240 [Bacteroides sp.]|nr:hypothetical protein [Bacteroides sp.]